MCGIAGIFSTSGKPVSSVIIKNMTEAVAHRGPDGVGHYVYENIGLGHRRLAILDLSPAGSQPMQTAGGRFVITYNGEVYNFEELRVELESLGYQFHTKTDTEVVLNAFVAWGFESFRRFNGMFALAIWNRQDRELILARDRYGIKPLYYTHSDDGIYFGSEIKAILAHPECHATLNQEGLIEYFTFQNFFTDKTLFNKIKLLPAGCYLRVQEKGMPQTAQYWDYAFVEKTSVVSKAEYLEKLDFLFQQAVNRQLVSDVPVSCYLSGGMDSGSITVVASKQIQDLKSFTIGFDTNSASGIELGFDERQKAEYISYLAHTEHYEMVLKAGDMERAMHDVVYHLEEPRVGQCYPNFYAAKLAGKFGKVVLAGTGGDEFFGGYPWRYYRAVINNGFEDYVDKYYNFWQRLLSNSEISQVFSPIWSNVKQVDTRQIFRNVFVSHADQLTRPEDYINHSMYFEAKTFLHGLLTVEDKLSMAHGLETRVPFLDNDLVDFAMQLPVNLKLGNLQAVLKLDENEPGHKAHKYFNKTKDGKLLLRRMMEKYIPQSITRSVKQGFSAPDASWFKGESIDFVRSTLLNRNAKLYNILDRVSIERLINEHLQGVKNRRLLIWSLLYFETWLQVFKV